MAGLIAPESKLLFGDGAEAARRERRSLTQAFAVAQGKLEGELAGRTLELEQASAAVAREIEARQQAEAAADELATQLARAREDEQRRLARDLHDQTGPSLTTLGLAVAQLRLACNKAPTPELLAALESLELAFEELGQGVREIVTSLRPAALDQLGLEAAIEQLLERWSENNGVAIEFECTCSTPHRRLPSDAETTLYRVVQEALTNVARHARAKQVRVELQHGEWLAAVVIEDDGFGFDPAFTPQGRYGLLGIRERLAPAHGSLEIHSQIGQGTRLTARLPLGPSTNSYDR